MIRRGFLSILQVCGLSALFPSINGKNSEESDFTGTHLVDIKVANKVIGFARIDHSSDKKNEVFNYIKFDRSMVLEAFNCETATCGLTQEVPITAEQKVGNLIYTWHDIWLSPHGNHSITLGTDGYNILYNVLFTVKRHSVNMNPDKVAPYV